MDCALKFGMVGVNTNGTSWATIAYLQTSTHNILLQLSELYEFGIHGRVSGPSMGEPVNYALPTTSRLVDWDKAIVLHSRVH